MTHGVTTSAQQPVVAEAAPSDRAEFIQKAYLHLAGAIGAFAVFAAILLQIPAVERFAFAMTNGMMWLVVLGAFMGISSIADRWASSDTSRGTQYLGLGLYTFAEAVIFLPLLIIATKYVPADSNVLGTAALITGVMVAGITAAAFITGKDYSFLRSFLMIGGFVAAGIIVASIIFKFNLGVVFAGGMCLFAAGSILHTTSNIIHHYRTDQYVAASLALFAGVALLFWYVLSVVIELADQD